MKTRIYSLLGVSLVVLLLSLPLLAAKPDLPPRVFLPHITSEGMVGIPVPPTPLPILRDGRYEYDDGWKKMYFTIRDRGRTIDNGGFTITSREDGFCKISSARYERDVETQFYDGAMRFEMNSKFGLTIVDSLKCSVIANNMAHCETYDYFAPTHLSGSSCGRDEAVLIHVKNPQVVESEATP